MKKVVFAAYTIVVFLVGIALAEVAGVDIASGTTCMGGKIEQGGREATLEWTGDATVKVSVAAPHKILRLESTGRENGRFIYVD